jgi:hypothetical protein
MHPALCEPVHRRSSRPDLGWHGPTPDMQGSDATRGAYRFERRTEAGSGIHPRAAPRGASARRSRWVGRRGLPDRLPHPQCEGDPGRQRHMGCAVEPSREIEPIARLAGRHRRRTLSELLTWRTWAAPSIRTKRRRNRAGPKRNRSVTLSDCCGLSASSATDRPYFRRKRIIKSKPRRSRWGPQTSSDNTLALLRRGSSFV